MDIDIIIMNICKIGACFSYFIVNGTGAFQTAIFCGKGVLEIFDKNVVL